MTSALTVNDVEYGALNGTPLHVDDGVTRQVRRDYTVLHRILIGAAPAMDETITLINGDEDADPVIAVILVPSTLTYPVIPVGTGFPDGLRVLFSGVIDCTLLTTP